MFNSGSHTVQPAHNILYDTCIFFNRFATAIIPPLKVIMHSILHFSFWVFIVIWDDPIVLLESSFSFWRRFSEPETLVVYSRFSFFQFHQWHVAFFYQTQGGSVSSDWFFLAYLCWYHFSWYDLLAWFGRRWYITKVRPLAKRSKSHFSRTFFVSGTNAKFSKGANNILFLQNDCKTLLLIPKVRDFYQYTI